MDPARVDKNDGDSTCYDMKADVVRECLGAVGTNLAFILPMTMSGRIVRDVVSCEPDSEYLSYRVTELPMRTPVSKHWAVLARTSQTMRNRLGQTM